MGEQLGIAAHGLVKRYGQQVALAGVDLAVPRGKVCGLLGPNGAGKTTAVRILTTLTTADAGTATAPSGSPWPIEHATLYTFVWTAAIVGICAPLAVRLYWGGVPDLTRPHWRRPRP